MVNGSDNFVNNPDLDEYKFVKLGDFREVESRNEFAEVFMQFDKFKRK